MTTLPTHANSVQYKKLLKGQVADFNGVLVSNKAWAKLGADRKLLLEKHKNSLTKQKEKLEAKHKMELSVCKSNLQITKNFCEKRVNIYRDRRNWCKNSPILYGFLGYFLGALSVLGGAYGLGVINNNVGK